MAQLAQKFFGANAIYTDATTLTMAVTAQAAAPAGHGANGERRAAFASERRAAFANSLTDEEPRAERNSERRQQPTPPASLQQSLRPPVVEEFMFRGSYTTEECAICFDEVHLRSLARALLDARKIAPPREPVPPGAHQHPAHPSPLP